MNVSVLCKSSALWTHLLVWPPSQSDVTPAQLEELEAAERWTQQQAMLAELDEQQEELQMIS